MLHNFRPFTTDGPRRIRSAESHWREAGKILRQLPAVAGEVEGG